jgi:hypothetical protein
MGMNWLQVGQDINGEAKDDCSAYSVSLSADGSTVAIGAIYNAGINADTNEYDNRGHVRVYKFNGTAWVKQGNDIDGETAGDQSGWSVSLSANGSTVAIGTPYNDGKGHVRVYKFVGGAWVKQGDDIDGEAAGDQSGYSVSLSANGSTVAIGARDNDVSGAKIDAGHVRVYKFIGDAWVKQGQDIDGEDAGDFSGHSVSLSADGSTVAIGAPYNTANFSTNNGLIDNRCGHVRVYKFISDAWVQQGQDIDGEDAGDFSGHSVSLSENGLTVAIGAHYNDGNGTKSGHVRVYKFISDAWVKQGDDIDGEAADDRSGHSVSLSADGSTVAIGAPYNDVSGNDGKGHVRVYKFIDGAWVQQGNDIDGEAVGDQSGYSVSLSANGLVVAIGAHYNNGANKSNSGHVRVYHFTIPHYGSEPGYFNVIPDFTPSGNPIIITPINSSVLFNPVPAPAYDSYPQYYTFAFTTPADVSSITMYLTSNQWEEEIIYDIRINGQANQLTSILNGTFVGVNTYDLFSQMSVICTEWVNSLGSNAQVFKLDINKTQESVATLNVSGNTTYIIRTATIYNDTADIDRQIKLVANNDQILDLYYISNSNTVETSSTVQIIGQAPAPAPAPAGPNLRPVSILLPIQVDFNQFGDITVRVEGEDVSYNYDLRLHYYSKPADTTAVDLCNNVFKYNESTVSDALTDVSCSAPATLKALIKTALDASDISCAVPRKVYNLSGDMALNPLTDNSSGLLTTRPALMKDYLRGWLYTHLYDIIGLAATTGSIDLDMSGFSEYISESLKTQLCSGANGAAVREFIFKAMFVQDPARFQNASGSSTAPDFSGQTLANKDLLRGMPFKAGDSLSFLIKFNFPKGNIKAPVQSTVLRLGTTTTGITVGEQTNITVSTKSLSNTIAPGDLFRDFRQCLVWLQVHIEH